VGRTANREKLAEALESAKKASRYVVVQVHSGIEYQRRASTGQQAMYRWLIDNGATIVVGHHPHVVQEIEIYKGKPIIYSLGNFVFDQYFSKDTQEGLSVGVVFKEGRVSALHLFPFFGVRSQVELMTGEKRKIFLEWMKKYSRLEGAVFEDGVITIN
jgi:poly-gamma-glutamate synthesis protein (capsule biosynthesis protein)